MQSSYQLDAGLPYIPTPTYRSVQPSSLSGAFDNTNLPQNLEICVRIDSFDKFSLLQEVCRDYVRNQGWRSASTNPYIALLLEIAGWIRNTQPGQAVRHPRAPIVGWYRAGPNGTHIGARCLDRDTGIYTGTEVPNDLLEPLAAFLRAHI